MAFAGETKFERDARLFKKDVSDWLSGKEREVPDILLREFRNRWNMWGDEAETRVKAILFELGWTQQGGMMVHKKVEPSTNSTEETAGDSLVEERDIKFQKPTIVTTSHVPPARRPGPKRDSDNQPYLVDRHGDHN